MSRERVRCLVVDDEPLASALISGYVNRTPFLELAGEASKAEDVLAVLNGGDVELIFLDIQMPGLSGMQLARLLPDDVRIIFTTAYSEYAVEGYRVSAVDYLLKPVSYEEFLQAAIRARNLLRPQATMPAPDNTTNRCITVKSEYRLVRIPLPEIEYIEGLKDYVKIYTTTSPKPILSLMSIKSLEESLPDASFMRVHRSFIVNLDHVRLVERTSIIMGDRSIPLSESYRKAFFERIYR